MHKFSSILPFYKCIRFTAPLHILFDNWPEEITLLHVQRSLKIPSNFLRYNKRFLECFCCTDHYWNWVNVSVITGFLNGLGYIKRKETRFLMEFCKFLDNEYFYFCGGAEKVLGNDFQFRASCERVT